VIKTGWREIARVLGAAVLMMGSGTALAVKHAVAAGDAPGYVAKVTRIGALTGPKAPVDMQGPDICGTDLGIIAELGSQLVFAFGDTFGWQDARCTRFGPNWRSNVIAFSDDADPSDGVEIKRWLSGADGRAVAAAEGAHAEPFKGEQSRIPTAMIAVGDALYLHTMSVHGFASMGGVWLCNNSRFFSSLDHGATWKPAAETFGDYKSSFNMLALSAAPGTGNEDGRYIHAIGTACGRYGGARIGRVPADQLTEDDAWEYFDGNVWVKDRAQAVEIIRPGVGEGSLVWNPGLKRWMFTTLNELSATIELRFADRPEGPWSDPVSLGTMSEFPQGYGAFMTQRWISPDGLSFYYVMSQFGPYNTYVMKAELTAVGS